VPLPSVRCRWFRRWFRRPRTCCPPPVLNQYTQRLRDRASANRRACPQGAYQQVSFAVRLAMPERRAECSLALLTESLPHLAWPQGGDGDELTRGCIASRGKRGRRRCSSTARQPRAASSPRRNRARARGRLRYWPADDEVHQGTQRGHFSLPVDVAPPTKGIARHLVLAKVLGTAAVACSHSRRRREGTQTGRTYLFAATPGGTASSEKRAHTSLGFTGRRSNGLDRCQKLVQVIFGTKSCKERGVLLVALHAEALEAYRPL
jgi:hypothetical protein